MESRGTSGRTWIFLILSLLFIIAVGCVISIIIGVVGLHRINHLIDPEPSLSSSSKNNNGISASAYGGELITSNKFAFAGVGFQPLDYLGTGCAQGFSYAVAGVSLVEIPGLEAVRRRIILTAGHSFDAPVEGGTSLDFPVHISFKANPGMIFDPKCEQLRFPVDFDHSATYKANHIWTKLDKISDFGIILLDEAVPASVVPDYQLGHIRRNRGTLSKKDIPFLGTVGYGALGWGDKADGTLGKPISTNGPRERMYVELETAAVNKYDIISKMIVARGDETTCNGDSGNAAIDINHNNEIVGVIASGDPLCRTLNLFNRVDSDLFNTWLASIIPEILAVANGQSTH